MQTSHVDVRQRIRNDIVEGTLAFGSRITIDELATRYMVSHMPVREALRDLQGEDLVIIEPNRGARVRSVDAKFVRNLFEMRTALEGMFVRQAASRCTPSDIAQLMAIQTELENRITQGDYPGVIRANGEFHRAINDLSDNPETVAIVNRHWTLIAALWRYYGYEEDRFEGVVNDHRHLIRALSDSDADAAAVIMHAHVVKARQNLLDRVRAHDTVIELAALSERSRRRSIA